MSRQYTIAMCQPTGYVIRCNQTIPMRSDQIKQIVYFYRCKHYTFEHQLKTTKRRHFPGHSCLWCCLRNIFTTSLSICKHQTIEECQPKCEGGRWARCAWSQLHTKMFWLAQIQTRLTMHLREKPNFHFSNSRRRRMRKYFQADFHFCFLFSFHEIAYPRIGKK